MSARGAAVIVRQGQEVVVSGSGSLMARVAAAANAVEDAVGVLITDLPVTAEKVYWALKEKQQS